ncbi:MAG: protein-L-isoaspartate(D-aspartate) O-methyltransferase [Melioribacter sp.]|uniref:protein-L-isoaspartate(D-aspartate) O-methyltransferase n=1 Tax=Rosettibacter primus TaxID=3111523 RepID=UPI00247C977D|nr:protein-L-isoaspartate(D-aspartate) O-methyltransferase [Melioribacter sp.]
MFEAERTELVNNLRKKGITDERVLEAMQKVERHRFVPEAVQHHAYKDIALPIGYGQTISQPYTVAIMTQALKVQPGDKILEIGTGSGYQAAILYEMGAKVFTIERNYELYNRALKIFDELNLKIAARCSDGTIGWDEFSPYNGIIVTAGSPSIPKALKKQLAVGGRLVIPVGDRQTQVLKILTKISDEEFSVNEIPYFAFVPLVGKEGWNAK